MFADTAETPVIIGYFTDGAKVWVRSFPGLAERGLKEMVSTLEVYR
jgi:hypothetical protein